MVDGVDARGMSRLGALFRWKSGKKTNLENFCTEGLAAAIVSDPSPVLGLLQSRGLLPGIAAAEVTRVAVDTQVVLPDKRIVDMQLVLHDAAGTARAIWIEVKTGAPLGPGQLEAYDAALRKAYPDGRGQLVVLSIGRRGEHTKNLRWQELWRVTASSAVPAWQDLRQFLEEQSVADTYNEPMTPEERRGLDGALVALRKTARALAHLVEKIKEQAETTPDLMPFGMSEDDWDFQKELALSFRNGYGLVAGGRRYGARFRLGVRHDKAAGTEVAFVMIWTKRSHEETRALIWGLLDSVPDGRFGTIDAGSRVARGLSKPLDDLAEEGALTQWWFEQVTALHACGALQKCGKSIKGETSEEDGDPEDAES